MEDYISDPEDLAYTYSGGDTYTFGMQCDEKRLMVEMDSQYNGAYCNMNKTGDVYPYDENRPYSYESWDYDNQLYLHKDQTYTGKMTTKKTLILMRARTAESTWLTAITSMPNALTISVSR